MSTTKKASDKTTRILKNAAKVLFVSVLLYFMAQKGFLSLEATRKALTQWDRSLPAMGALALLLLAGILRWHWLLHGQDIPLRFGRTLQLHFIGLFFNLALPGAVSGDLVKAFYIAHEVPGKRGRAFGSILFDRVAGVSALVLVSAGALLLNYQALHGTALFRGVKYIVLTAALSVIAFYGYLFLVREHHDPLLRGFRALEKKYSKASSLTHIYEGLRHYHNRRWVVFKVLTISIAIHLTVCWACLQFAYALGDAAIDPLSVVIVVPLGLLVTAVPIMPAGIGTGHAAFGALFLLLNSQRGADVFSLFALTQIFLSSLGGLVYLRFRAHEPLPAIKELNKEAAL